MSTKQQSCEERINESMDYCEEYLELLFKVMDDYSFVEDDEDDVRSLNEIESEGIDEDTIYEYALGVSKKTVIRIELSTGGPASFIEAFIDDENDIYKIEYHFQDWFDGARRSVSKNSPIWRYAEFIVEGMI